ncbi:MAG: DUF1178 family protein [Hyphomicrobium sp.]|uniref:DUF1178 family protein n=1 Tax=Hyphomicrobium sp. TaxID=82 RepID=UPI003D101711
MIRFSLVCRDGHEFEAWFQSGAAYEAQSTGAQVACPQCGSHEVDKAIMAPAVATRAERGGRSPYPSAAPQDLQHQLRRVRDEVRANAQYVGGRFAEEARRIHFEESEPRGVYGEATPEEVRGLAEDGVPFMPMPRLPEDMN